jgi:Fe-S cluster assembly protein SufD
MVSSKGEHTVCPRLHIHLEEGAEASVIEEYLGLHAESQWTQTVLSAQLDSRSTLHHIKVQTEGARTYHLADARFVLGEASTLNTLTLALGALVGREDLHIELQGSGAQARLDGLYIPRKRMHLDHHTEVFHQVPHCVSAQNYRGIVDDAGRAVFNGRVVVARDAQKTAAEQHNANLLLSDQAEIDTKPQLEIFADDVKCSHGATIGALNPQELFYLRSRGLDAVAARALVTYAFAARCLSGIKASPSLKAGLQNCILRALPGADDLTGLVE